MSAALEDALYQRALQTATPATLPLIKRSAYLADALRSMQTDTAPIRTGGTLAANLLADAVLKYGSDRADNKLAAAQAADQESLKNLQLGNLLDPAAQGGSASGGPPPTASAAPPVTDARAASPAGLADAIQNSGPPTTQSSLSPYERIGISSGPQDLLPLAQAVYGEAGGESPDGQRATASTILNRSLNSGQPLADVVAAPHQFEGYNAKSRSLGMGSPQLSPVLANLAGLLSGETPDPTNGATNFYSPGAQASLGRPPPAWDNGHGQQIGHQLFFGGQPQGAPPQPGPGAPPGAPLMQVATNGPLPQMGAPPPQGGQGAPPPNSGVMQPPPPNAAQGAPPMAAQGGPAPAVAPPPAAGAPSIPTGPGPTPGELAMIKQLTSDPRTLQQGLQMAMKIRERMASPAEAPKNMTWSPQAGRFVPMPGTETTQLPGLSPSDNRQRDPFGSISDGTIPGVQGALEANQVQRDGQVSQLPVQRNPTFRIPGSPGLYTLDAKGNPQKVAEDSYTVKDLGADLSELQKSPQYTALDNATNMFSAAVQAAARPGGINDVELRDFAARQFSGGVARQFNVEALNNAQGVWSNLKQFIPELTSGQHLSPGARQTILQAMHDDAVQAQNAFGGLAKSKMAFAAQQGADLSPFVSPLMRSIPAVPNLSAIPGGLVPLNSPGGNSPAPGAGGPGGNNAGPGMANRPSPAAVEAELRRRGVIK